jgi:hypothetical protein
MHTAISYLTEEQYQTLLHERVQLAQEQLAKPESERLEVFIPLEARELVDRPPRLD